MADKKISLQKISCDSCGAELIFNPKSQSTLCNFCGSTFEIEKAEKNLELILPDGILPFRVTKDQFKTGMLEWLSEGDYTPDDILSSSVFDEYNGVYLPMYFFSGQYSGNWSASSGYERQEEYTTRDSQGRLVRKTRTVTDWRPSNGQIGGSYNILAFAGNPDINADVVLFCQDTGLNKGAIKEFDIKYTLNFSLLEFITPEDQSWDALGQVQLDSLGKSDIKTRIPGDTYKDLRYDLSFKHKSIGKYYIPTWVAFYKYSGEEYHVCFDGSELSRKDGSRPVDEKRQKAAKMKFMHGHVGLGATAGLLLFTIFGIGTRDPAFDAMFSFSMILGGITILLYIIGYFRKKNLLKRSKIKRQEILNKIKSGESVDVEQIEE